MRTAIPILLYHSIATDITAGFRPWTLAPAVFDAHMGYLHENAYSPLTITQLVQTMRTGKPLPTKPVLISFDDGLADFYEVALPSLKRYSIPATLYVVSGYIGSTSRWLASEGESLRRMLTWQQIREAERAGMEIGAHTHTHPQLDILTDDEAWTEIARSKWRLEEELGHRVESFAYPHGYYSPSVRKLVQQAGFSSACAVKHAFSANDDDHFSLARIMITNEVCVDRLDRLLNGRKLRIAPRQEEVRTRVWRMARRARRLMERVRLQPGEYYRTWA